MLSGNMHGNIQLLILLILQGMLLIGQDLVALIF